MTYFSKIYNKKNMRQKTLLKPHLIQWNNCIAIISMLTAPSYWLSKQLYWWVGWGQ